MKISDSASYASMTDVQRRAIFEAGLTLHAIQSAEHVLSCILTWNFPKAPPIHLAGLEAMSVANRRSTLGRILTDLRKRSTIDPGFDTLLDKFLDHRNRFVHRLFAEDDLTLDTDTGSERAIAFMLDLQDIASHVQQTLTSFIIFWSESSGDPNLVAFAHKLIHSTDKPYEFTASSKDVFRKDPCA